MIAAIIIALLVAGAIMGYLRYLIDIANDRIDHLYELEAQRQAREDSARKLLDEAFKK